MKKWAGAQQVFTRRTFVQWVGAATTIRPDNVARTARNSRNWQSTKSLDLEG